LNFLEKEKSMLIKVKDFIVNTNHITYAEWRKINEGSPSETHNLIIYFSVSAKNLSLREDEEVRKIWAFLENQCQCFGTKDHESVAMQGKSEC
jgi:hypothetical protein